MEASLGRRAAMAQYKFGDGQCRLKGG